MTTHTLRIADRDIHMSETGSGPPLLLLHGGGPGASGLSNYGRNIDALARYFRVIVPDMPGYGQSTKRIDKSDSFGDLAAAMRGLLDALGVDKAHIAGNSLGGATGLRLAMDAPARVNRLVLMGPGGIGTTRALPTRGLNNLLHYYKGEGPTRAKLERFIRNDLVAPGIKVDDALIEARFRDSIRPEVVANPPLTRPPGLRALWRMDLTRDRRLRNLPHPVLVLWGANDRVNRPSGADWLRRHLPDCSTYILARTGHWVQWERANQFNALTTAFLEARA
ncbi:alpha/beta fold hydrolase [Paracoccus sp. (in: a-proteobacteria)]|uniref:alpha/beta fold hydrolase n=1 Tax=Paracoccus sp. TaxID=267 RepID=UPI0026DFB58E|nr:alpha/beta fold hydrolase [Paracoccus sp. (in: a-proteobacteria)]